MPKASSVQQMPVSFITHSTHVQISDPLNTYTSDGNHSHNSLCVEHESVYLRDHSASVAGGAERLHLPPNLRDVDFGKSGVFVTACGMRV